MTPPIAHAGHWIADLLYVAPLAVALGFLFVQSRRDKRREEAEGGASADSSPPAEA
ncbi:MAG TPA: hypothetical protein VL120_01670 [Solirubrobacteraceae bacterium]|jgi:hypothetical protein|nr:hypothetical protein [Solirubrobacteraceae bacterium]